MVDFTLNKKEQEIVSEIRREGMVRRKYARYFDEHEDELAPDALPEAKEFDHIAEMGKDRGDDACGRTVL